MASAVTSYAVHHPATKMHQDPDATGVGDFDYEQYAPYTKKPGDRGLTISTNAPLSPKDDNKSTKSSEVGSPTDGKDRGDHMKPRLCTVPGCKKRVRSKGLCKAHGGGRRCMVEGCERSSQGQGLCIRHGGGKRCTQPGCTKASQSNGLCKAHGGGLRCMANNCTKSSQGGGFCRAHGGGQRCEKEGCNKGAQRGGFCAGHGGSRFCQHPDCTKNDRGGGYCAEHGGGKRCDQQGCNKPARKKGKCSHHANASKQKATKEAPTSVPPPMMDMRQITAPQQQVYNMPPKDVQGMRDSMDSQHSAMRSYPPYQQRVVMDQRYAKGYEQPPMNSVPQQYMPPMHPEQRGYDPMGMPPQASRHYMDAPVSQGYSASHKHPGAGMDRGAPPQYDSRSGHPGHPGHHAPHPGYSQHWSSKDGVPPTNMQGRGSMEYFEENAPPQHHQPYNHNTSAPYHHHMSVPEQQPYGNQRENYYNHGPPPSSTNEPPMYGSYSYQPHQMHNMNLL